MTNHKPHKLDQSALYRVTTRRKLAEVLLAPLPTLERIAAIGRRNYQCFWHVPKTGKKKRWIENPLPVLKKLQRRIHTLLARVQPPEFMFSGFPRRSATMNAAEHNVETQMVKLDIASFYPSSDGRRVFRLFRDDMQCAPDVAGLLYELTTLQDPVENGDKSHLPTGAVTSPILAYYGYRSMFEELLLLAQTRGVVMTVMVDDITFSGKGADHQLLAEARLIVRRHGLQSKRNKERVWAKMNPKLVTGVVLTTSGPRLPNKRRQRIDDLWRELHQTEGPIERAVLYQRLVGSLFSAGQIEDQFQKKGRAVCQVWRKDVASWNARLKLHKKNPSRGTPREKRAS